MSRTNWFRGAWRPLSCALLTCGLLLACGDDDDGDDVTGPGDGGEPGDELLDAEVFCGLSDGVTQAGGLLLQGGGIVDSPHGGQIVVTGTTVAFEDYSPGGDVVFNGAVVVGFAEEVTVTGTIIQTEGGQDTEIGVNLRLTGQLNDPTFAGTMSFDGEVVDLESVDTPDCGS